MNKNNILQTIKTIALALILVLGVGYAQAQQFQGPTAQPPQQNVDAPVNVGSVYQIKNGDLGVNNFVSFGDASVFGNTFLREQSSNPKFAQEKLDVDGGVIIRDHESSPISLPCISTASYTQAFVTASGLSTSSSSCLSPSDPGYGVWVAIYDTLKIDVPALGNKSTTSYDTETLKGTMELVNAHYGICANDNGKLVRCIELAVDKACSNKTSLTITLSDGQQAKVSCSVIKSSLQAWLYN